MMSRALLVVPAGRNDQGCRDYSMDNVATLASLLG
jgi:hypothetical protein